MRDNWIARPLEMVAGCGQKVVEGNDWRLTARELAGKWKTQTLVSIRNVRSRCWCELGFFFFSFTHRFYSQVKVPHLGGWGEGGRRVLLVYIYLNLALIKMALFF